MSEPDPREKRETEIVELIRSSDVRAPDSLHDAVAAMIAGRSAPRRRDARERSYSLRPRLAALGAIAAAVIALAIVIGTSGSSSTLSVHDAAALTLRAATAGPPPESSSNHTELSASVDGIAFPYWGAHFGWRQTGMRSDELDGRTVTTVFYEGAGGRRVGYAIAAGGAPPIAGGVVSHRDGTPYRMLTVHGAPVVAWTRAGRLCVVSGSRVDGATLLRLASWQERPAQSS